MNGGKNGDVTYIAVTNYQNRNIKFGIKQSDRGGHIYCIGKTGSGKSTLLLNMAISDITNSNGVGIIEPHGDISETILDYVPEERIQDVIYFNCFDREYPIAFNPLYNIPKSEHYLVASNLVGAFKKIWNESWGPRLEHILRNAILTLLHFPQASLLDIQPLLTNSDFRKDVLDYVEDTGLLNFWYKEFYAMPPQLRVEAISPIVNKVGLFHSNPVLRNIISQKKSAFSVAEIMNGKKIFIANLSKGVLGEDGTQLLGSMLVTAFQTAALGRAQQSTESRYPFNLFIDEMHSFVTLSFADILSESRKYGLSLFLTHQYIDQLEEDIRNAILGNVGTIISFRIGANDARVLEQEFTPVFTFEDLINLPQYHIYIKLLIDGTTSRPFSAVTLPMNSRKYNNRQEIIDLSRNKHAEERYVIEMGMIPGKPVIKKYGTLFD